jgi:tripartite-type tricarboxylate transporter receptor subunit TctC
VGDRIRRRPTATLGEAKLIHHPSVRILSLALFAGVFAGAAAATCRDARAADAASFYRGKSVRFIIPYGPGGGYDYYGRAVARHIGRHIPGAPVVVPQNMPGAGTLKATNYIYAQAPKDGTILGIPSSSIALNEVLKVPGVTYRSKDFVWVGRVAYSVDITFSWHASKTKSIQDAMTRQTQLAGAGPGSSGTLNPRLLNYLVGTKFKVVLGYPSSGAMMLAMERGETDGAYGSTTTLRTRKPQWLRDKKVNILVQYTDRRYPDAADVPTMVELGKTPLDKEVLKLFATSSFFGKVVLSTPGVPADRVTALRGAFDAMIKDKKFVGELHKAKADIGYLSGNDVQARIEDIAKTPADVLKRARQAYKASALPKKKKKKS